MALVAFMAMTGAAASSAADERSLYIVVLDDAPLAAYEGGIQGLAPTAPAVTGARKLDADSPASTAYRAYLAAEQNLSIASVETALGREVDVRFRYDAVLNGYAVRLDPDEADAVRSLPGVQSVTRDRARQLLTDNGPSWIGAPAIWNASSDATKGEGVVVGVIDTGINHDHPSFADVGGDGYDHTNPRAPQFYGACAPVTGLPICNDKLIGVWDFTGPEVDDPTYGSDTNGHGSHTSSTAAGNVLPGAVLEAPTLSLQRNISGVAPHANIIMYKACVGVTAPVGECVDSATTASINQAALDGVDVVNFSIGGGPADPWTDNLALAMLNARAAGVFIAASAGNDGPGAGTVGVPGTSPWVTTVGAATHDRKITNALVNLSGGGSTPPGDMNGKGLSTGYGSAPIIYAGAPPYNSPLCGGGALAADGENSTTNPFVHPTTGQPLLNGQIVLCERGTYGRVAKGRNVKAGGGGGMILMNDALNGDSLVGDAHALPAVHISHANGNTLKAWLATGSGHTGTIQGFQLSENPEHGDITASFSSRGPNAAPNVIKPDVTAPGVDILAAFADGATPSATDFGIISGTSMSSPHTAGAAALVVDQHPLWTPDEVRSALMTTAFTTAPGNGSEVHDVLKENGSTAADPFDMGAGRVDLNVAGKAGLVLDETPANYTAANPASGGDPRTLNLPSMADDACNDTCSWTRTVKSTAPVGIPVTWTVVPVAPEGVSLTVTPLSFNIAPGETQTLTITAGVTAAAKGQWHFGQVKLRSSAVVAAPDAHLPLAVFAEGEAPPPPSTDFYFHGVPEDQANKLDSFTFGTHPPAGSLTFNESSILDDQPVVQSNNNPNSEYHLNPNAVWWAGPYSGELDDKQIRIEWWWQTCNASALAFGVDMNIKVIADPDFSNPGVGTQTVIGQVNTTFTFTGCTPTKFTTIVPVDGTVNGELLIQAASLFTDTGTGLQVLYDHADTPSKFSVPKPPSINPLDHRFVADFNGDGKDEIAVWRQSNGTWYVQGNFGGVRWGQPGDIPVPADYNGDGADEFAVWRPSNGNWYVHGDFGGIQWGQPGDIPVPGDYDGDLDDDPAVYRASSSWHWYIRGMHAKQWGHADNIPVPGDYDADAADDIATFRTTDGTWFLEDDYPGVKLGEAGDIPVQADYDGNGKEEYAVWRPSDGMWFVRNQGITAHWGTTGDIPVPGDYDADPADDETVWRPTNGTWYVHGNWSGVQWGAQGDVP